MPKDSITGKIHQTFFGDPHPHHPVFENELQDAAKAKKGNFLKGWQAHYREIKINNESVPNFDTEADLERFLLSTLLKNFDGDQSLALKNVKRLLNDNGIFDFASKATHKMMDDRGIAVSSNYTNDLKDHRNALELTSTQYGFTAKGICIQRAYLAQDKNGDDKVIALNPGEYLMATRGDLDVSLTGQDPTIFVEKSYMRFSDNAHAQSIKTRLIKETKSLLSHMSDFFKNMFSKNVFEVKPLYLSIQKVRLAPGNDQLFTDFNRAGSTMKIGDKSLLDVLSEYRVTHPRKKQPTETTVLFDDEADLKAFVMAKILHLVPEAQREQAYQEMKRVAHQGGALNPVSSSLATELLSRTNKTFNLRSKGYDEATTKTGKSVQERTVTINPTPQGFSVFERVIQRQVSPFGNQVNYDGFTDADKGQDFVLQAWGKVEVDFVSNPGATKISPNSKQSGIIFGSKAVETAYDEGVKGRTLSTSPYVVPHAGKSSNNPKNEGAHP